VRLLATELGDALARLRRMRAAAKILDICRIGRGGAGLLGVGPGLLVRRLAGLFVERDDALARLRYVRAGAEVLQIRRICRDGAGLLGVGPGLLVSLLARLLTGRLLLLGPRLLRIRGLAASRHEGRPRNDCNDRQFQKCDTSTAGLPTQIIRHGWPFPGLHARSLLFQRRRGSPVQYVPKLRRGQRRPHAPRLPAPTRRRRRRFRGALPDRSVVELNGHAVRGIDRAKIGPGNPEAAGVIHPASGWLADLVDQVELPTILGDEGEAGPTRQAARDAPI